MIHKIGEHLQILLHQFGLVLAKILRRHRKEILGLFQAVGSHHPVVPGHGPEHECQLAYCIDIVLELCRLTVLRDLHGIFHHIGGLWDWNRRFLNFVLARRTGHHRCHDYKHGQCL